jgi:hypothetical protein
MPRYIDNDPPASGGGNPSGDDCGGMGFAPTRLAPVDYLTRHKGLIAGITFTTQSFEDYLHGIIALRANRKRKESRPPIAAESVRMTMKKKSRQRTSGLNRIKARYVSLYAYCI